MDTFQNAKTGAHTHEFDRLRMLRDNGRVKIYEVKSERQGRHRQRDKDRTDSNRKKQRE